MSNFGILRTIGLAPGQRQAQQLAEHDKRLRTRERAPVAGFQVDYIGDDTTRLTQSSFSLPALTVDAGRPCVISVFFWVYMRSNTTDALVTVSLTGGIPAGTSFPTLAIPNHALGVYRGYTPIPGNTAGADINAPSAAGSWVSMPVPTGGTVTATLNINKVGGGTFDMQHAHCWLKAE